MACGAPSSTGTWFAYNGERLGQGRENAKQFLKDNRDTFKAIEERVRKELGLDGAPKELPGTTPEAPIAAAAGAGRGNTR